MVPMLQGRMRGREEKLKVMDDARIGLGISACLLGQPVRFDGGHKRDPFLVESLGAFVEWVSVCARKWSPAWERHANR